ncbi:hypothetical protein HMPREF1137_0398 [Actinomyces sp. ICM39]|uniref:DUF6668 family protein n=1 Tax=Actinomyces sp. ICM39 TaxID=1105029 RepID=UPI00027709F4|nr:DUF6668 family protein [Actinomyces sp. ICM39]EJN45029.1 hypothetical protein HMPREF1137_0398 [Actinomyces sp. ICM39]
MPIPPPPAVVAARPWAPGVDGLTVRRHIRRSTVDGAPLLWIVGAHGGAGTSTWAHLLGAGDAGAAWPQHVNPTRLLSIVVCCRSTAAGLRAAQDVAIEWASGALPGQLVGLVVGADAPGRLPRELRDQLQITSGAFPHCVFVPWQAHWRFAKENDVNADHSRRINKIAATVAAWTERILG